MSIKSMFSHSTKGPSWLAICVVFIAGASALLVPQTNGQAKQGAVERIKVHAKSLEGNLDGDSPDRDVSVYLPPCYKTEKNRRYPVIYMLHGFTDDDAKWFGMVKHWINLPEVINGITHFYESYDGDHLNRIAERLQTKTLPFFSQHLAFEKARR